MKFDWTLSLTLHHLIDCLRAPKFPNERNLLAKYLEFLLKTCCWIDLKGTNSANFQ
uniref:Uncharacterized protein n=1 Tax=Rhizophora mucronata TaxID=61149 RepID=A0A2P2KZL7_RHIMU